MFVGCSCVRGKGATWLYNRISVVILLETFVDVMTLLWFDTMFWCLRKKGFIILWKNEFEYVITLFLKKIFGLNFVMLHSSIHPLICARLLTSSSIFLFHEPFVDRKYPQQMIHRPFHYPSNYPNFHHLLHQIETLTRFILSFSLINIRNPTENFLNLDNILHAFNLYYYLIWYDFIHTLPIEMLFF